MPNKSISYLIGFLVTCVSFLAYEVNAGIKKKDFKSKTVSELIDVLNNDELLEKKFIQKVDKKFMCKFYLATFHDSIRFNKENLANTAKALAGSPPEFMRETIKQTEQITINQLKLIEKYCP